MFPSLKKDASMDIDEQRAALQSKLAELEADKAKAEAKAKANSGPRDIPMDTEDKLRLENVLLRERIMERDRQDARDSLHEMLLAKYNVDSNTEVVTLDANQKIITVSAKS